jgi:hypothetical protein
MTDQSYQIKEKLASLEEALLSRSPEMPTLLRTIHSQLKKDPDLVTILSPEECSVLVRGLVKQTGINIAATTVKKKSGSKAMSKMQPGLDL